MPLLPLIYHLLSLAPNFQGTPSGEAFIQMESELAAESTAVNRHKKFMLLAGIGGGKKRYIEVFQCSSNDMSVVLANQELPSNLHIPGVNIAPQTPAFASGLPPALNLTPPGLSSPQQGSPPSVQVAGQTTLQATQPFTMPQLQPLIQQQRSQIVTPGNSWSPKSTF